MILQGMDYQKYLALLDEVTAIQYLIIKSGGMATKSKVEDILMARFSLDRGDAHSLTNDAESRQDFMIVNGRVVWQAKHRQIPQIEDYPEIQND